MVRVKVYSPETPGKYTWLGKANVSASSDYTKPLFLERTFEDDEDGKEDKQEGGSKKEKEDVPDSTLVPELQVCILSRPVRFIPHLSTLGTLQAYFLDKVC